MKKLLSISTFLFLIASCDPCNDCDSVAFEPTVLLKFINQDSIKNIDDSLNVISQIDSSLKATISSLLKAKDSLNKINDSIANGGTLSQEKIAIESLISQSINDTSLFATRNKGADSIRNILNQTKSTINTGRIVVDQIKILGTNTSFSYTDTDSAEQWSIPLAYDGTFSQYEISIDKKLKDVIELSYENFTEVDEKRNVLIRAKNIRIVDKAYNEIDSIQSNCEENCIDGKTSFTIYF